MEFVTVEVPRPDPKKPFLIMPLGDIQYAGQKGPTALDLLKRRIDYGLKKGAKFLGLGDYIDFMSPSNRQKRRSAGFYDYTEDGIDDHALSLNHELYEKALKPTKGHWIAMLQGHHYTQLDENETSDMRLAEMLDTVFVGDTVYGRVSFKGMGDVIFWASHGVGSGTRSSAPLNKLETLANYWEADIFFLGHMSKMAASPLNRVYSSWKGSVPHLLHKKILLVGCGGFAKGYMERYRRGRVPCGGYVEKALMNPATLGNPLVQIFPTMASRETADKVRQRLWEPELTVEI